MSADSFPRLRYFASLPLRCLLFGHDVDRDRWLTDTDPPYVEQEWWYCARCREWLGHGDERPRRR